MKSKNKNIEYTFNSIAYGTFFIIYYLLLSVLIIITFNQIIDNESINPKINKNQSETEKASNNYVKRVSREIIY